MIRVVTLSLLTLVVVALTAHFWPSGTQRTAEEHWLLSELNLAEGDAYRQEQMTLAGSLAMPGGAVLQLIHLAEGPQPEASDWLRLHYRGLHIDGRVFDDTWRRQTPVVVPLERTIAGWQQILPSIPVGSRVRLILPPELAYGDRGGGAIGPNETLVFEIEVLAIEPTPVAEPIPLDQQAVPGLR